MATPKKPSKDKTLHEVYQGFVTVRNLPKDIYFYNAGKMMSGMNRGFGAVSFAYNSPDYKLYESIADHIYMFSGAKTFQQTLEMSRHLIKDGRIATFEEFKEKAGQIFDEYNENWLRSEYETAKDGGRMAEKWLHFERNKKDLPMLTYTTEHDDTVCEICEPLDGITLPVGDPFWSEFYPPLHFNCHCDVQAHDREDDEWDDEDVFMAIQDSNPQGTFRNNVGKTGQIFSDKHPYFQIPKQYRTLAADNFNLPIPKNHGRYSKL